MNDRRAHEWTAHRLRLLTGGAKCKSQTPTVSVPTPDSCFTAWIGPISPTGLVSRHLYFTPMAFSAGKKMSDRPRARGVAPRRCAIPETTDPRLGFSSSPRAPPPTTCVSVLGAAVGPWHRWVPESLRHPLPPPLPPPASPKKVKWNPCSLSNLPLQPAAH